MIEQPFTPASGSKTVGWLRLVAIALLGLAMLFRFAHLDRKVYWHDEAYTSLTITANSVRRFTDDLFQNKVVKPADLLRYQELRPQATLADMVMQKGLEDVQHPPLYYILLRFWAQVWGMAPAILRGFSALLSLLLFPALYWLCLELFESSTSGWVAIALFAVSPLHLVYGQEAREFGVWTALFLASSALLLQAMRSPSWRNWVWYGASMVVGFYTALFSLCIALGHAAYILFADPENRFLANSLRLGKRTMYGAVALVAAAILFLPWIYFILVAQKTLSNTTSWSSVPIPWPTGLRLMVFNFSQSFVDFNLSFTNAWAYLFALPILILQGYAVYRLCRQAPQRIWWFILTLIGSTALFFGLPDLLFGGQRFTVNRYLIPCFVGLHLAVVYLLTTYLTEAQAWKRRFAKLSFLLLILLGITSCGVYAQSNTWWNKVLNSNYHQVADIINNSERPLVIGDDYLYYPVSLISLSYLIKPETQLLLLPSVGENFAIQTLPAEVETVFLFNLPEVFRQQFEVQLQKELTLAFKDPWNEIWAHYPQ